MHGVVVIPLAAPDEAMLLENMDDLPGNLVLVGKAAIGLGLRPCPIVRVRAGNVDRNTEAVSAVTIRSGNRTAIVSPLGRPQIREEALRQLVELIRHVLQRCGRAIDFGEFDGFAVLARQPHNVGRVRHEAGGTAVAVDLFEQWRISHTSRIEIDGWRKALLADGIFITNISLMSGSSSIAANALAPLPSSMRMRVPSFQTRSLSSMRSMKSGYALTSAIGEAAGEPASP